MKLTTTDFTPGGTIPTKFTFNQFGCQGENVPPQFSWTDVPDGTKALAFTCFDLDAPTSVGWVHWLAMRVPTTASSTADLLKAVQGRNDYGLTGYGGPCPPPGDKPHRYVFTLYALDTDFAFDESTTYAAFRFMIRENILEKAEVTGTFGR